MRGLNSEVIHTCSTIINLYLQLVSVIQNVNLKSQGTKFMCKLTLTHTHKKVNIKKSKAQCMPTFPKIKKIIKVKVKQWCA